MDMGTSETGLIMRLLDATRIRQHVIANNISNSNTPGFVRQDVSFEDLLNAESNPDRRATIVPKIVDDTETPARPDGNNVLPEKESSELHKNRIMYETYVSVLKKHFDLIEAAIRGQG
jgi:flagellar basal-body rod protein FlgB